MNNFHNRYIKENNWYMVSITPGLTSDDLEVLYPFLEWNVVSQYQHLSSEDLEKFQDRLNWFYISKFQILSSKKLEKFKDQLQWGVVSEFQHLSSEDLEKYQDVLSWYLVSISQKLSTVDLEKFKFLVYPDLQVKHHKEKTMKQKKREMAKYAKKHNLEFDGEFLYAFRMHDVFGRGTWNKNIFYEKGKYYRDWHVDMDPNEENSFGLGIWPEGNTPIKVAVDDWGLEISTDKHGKCRVWGFTVI